MEDNIFDKIVALRISLMDTYYDEKTIIYYIKKNLHRYDGYETEEDLNNVIIEFYKRYDIDITTINLEEIKVVNEVQTPSNPNINNLLNLFSILNSIQGPVGPNHESLSNTSNLESSTSTNNLESPTSTSNIESLDASELDTDTEGLYENDINSEDYSNSTNFFTSENTHDSESINHNFPILNSLINLNNNQNPNINPEHFLSVINTFNNVLNNTNTNTYNQNQDFEDVIVTLDEKDYQNLNEINYKDLNVDQKNNLDSKCSICLGSYENTDKLIILNCKHCFHSDCIKEWLKEYDYKCPVCRAECGKTQNNL